MNQSEGAMMFRTRAGMAVLVTATLSATLASPARAHPASGSAVSTSVGYGGAVVTVDADATRAGLEVLRRGGNAVDAAVAAAATLGVTEPFSAGVGGGGFFLYYN